MRRAVVRITLCLAALAAVPGRAAAERPRAADLSVHPRERDPFLFLRERDPDLYERAVSGDRMASGGAALVVLGAIATPVGLFLLMSDAWAAGAEARPGERPRTSRRGPVVLLAGGSALTGGFALVVGGRTRRDEAVQAFYQRELARRPAR